MNLRRVFVIFRKDLLDAFRDARVLITLITPLLLGVFYSYAFGDTSIPSASLVVYDPGNSALVDKIGDTVKGSIDLSIHRLDNADAVHQRIADDKADLGLIIPADFDNAIETGKTPNLEVLVPQNSSIGGQYMLASLDPILRSMAGQQLPAKVNITSVELEPANLTIIDKMSMRTWAIVLALVMMVSMVALLALPIILAEETEKKTIDALVLVSSYGEVVWAKALLGVSYVAVMSAILLGITRLRPIAFPWFLVSIVALAICLLGFGLLLGSLFKSATQLNTWSGLLLFPALIPAGIIGFGLPKWVDRIASLTPTGAGMKLLTNAFTKPRIYNDPYQMLVVLAVWIVIFYGLLLWQLSRRRG